MDFLIVFYILVNKLVKILQISYMEPILENKEDMRAQPTTLIDLVVILYTK